MTIYSVGHAIAFLSSQGWFEYGDPLKKSDDKLGAKDTVSKTEPKALETSPRERLDRIREPPSY
jgi:hypothetical protein